MQGGISNSRAAELRAMHYRQGKGYRMNRYNRPPYGASAVTTFGARFDPDLRYLARRYESATRNFQPAIAPTRPNVMMALNATAHDWYYNRRDPHPAPWYSIFDELTEYSYTWKIYLGLPTWLHPRQSWFQLVPRRHRADVTTASQFFTDLSSGTLPRFSFVRPGFGYSEEPREDIAEGDAWLGQLVQAVARSRYWDSTAIFLTYDEGGGFWDPVPPPVTTGYGTRTPMVIVSPWARRGAYTRRTTNISILSFMQHLWRHGTAERAQRTAERPGRGVRLPAAAAAPAQAPGGPVRHDRLPRCEPGFGGADRAPASLAADLPRRRNHRAVPVRGAVRPAVAVPAHPEGRSATCLVSGADTADRRARDDQGAVHQGRLLPDRGGGPGRQRRLDHDRRAAGPPAPGQGDRGVLAQRPVMPAGRGAA